MSADYTDADVQAGADRIDVTREAWFDSDSGESLDAWYTRAVLDAVVPGIVARAKAEALRESAVPMIAHCDKHGYGDDASIQPDCDWCSAFGVDQDWVDLLTLRADEIERP